MDYEKKYKDALERAKNINNEHRAQPFDVMTKVFPELKESDDDRIRKEIIYHIQNCDDTIDEVKEKRMIAWLEKQGKSTLESIKEEKVAWSEEDETALGDALWCCKQAASIAKDENDMGNIWYAENWLKSLKDRVKPQWKPKDIHLEALRCVINGNNLDVIALKDLLEQLKKL